MGDEKKMQSGVLNLGSLYEEVVAAYFALELVKDSDVTNFNIKLNPSSYQKFDDIVIKIEHKDGQTEKLALQLKHRETKREQLDVKEFDRKGKGFEILQYQTAFNKLNCKVQDSHKFILFTNAQFLNINDYESNNCCIKSVTNAFKTPLFNMGKTLQLKNKGHSSNKFFDKFFFISEQQNFDSLKNTVITIFEEDFYAKRTDALQYLEFFGNLRKNFSRNEVDMNEVILKLLDILSAEILIKIPTKKELNKKLQLLDEVFKLFDISLVQVNVENFKQYKINIKQNSDNINLPKNKSVKDKLLPITEKPLFVATSENSQQKIYQLIKLSQFLKKQVSFVLVGENNKIREKLKTSKIFNKLIDLKKVNVLLYEKISETFKVSLQGRKPEAIKTLKDTFGIDLDEILGPNELIQALNNELIIGTKIQPLPEHFINRQLKRDKIISPEELPRICKENETVVHCNGSLNHLKSFITSSDIRVDVVEVKNYNPNMNYEKPVLILSSEKSCPKIQDCYYHLEVATKSNLKWRITTINLNHSEIYDSQLSIISEDPGFGKTTIMNFLAINCSLNYWVINVPLKQLGEILNKSSTIEDFFKNFIYNENDIDYEVMMALKKKKSLMIFFDGLDELCEDNIQYTIDVVKLLLHEGYKCWISCTRRLEDTLKECLEPLVVYEIAELTEEEQKIFIRSKMKNEKMTKDVDDVEEKLLNPNEIGLDKYILKSPLCLHILTETVKKLDINTLKEHLNNAQLYSLFIDGTLHHKLEEARYDKNSTNLKKVIEMYKDVYIEECQIGALKACLETEHFEKLKVSNTNAFLNQIKKNGDFMNIIIKINTDSTFIFSHYSFSEYFAALWLFENFKSIPLKERRFLYKPEYVGIRYFLNPMLANAKNCLLHFAVHNRNLSKAQSLVKEHFDNFDEGNRTALHVASTLGVKHLISKDGTIQKVETFKTGDEMEILKHLINTQKFEILKKDKMYEWNCFQYADASFSLSFLEELSKKTKLKQCYLNNYSNLSRLSEACIKYGYITIFKKLIKWETLEKLDTGNKPFLHLAIENNQTEIATLLINQVDFKKVDDQKQTALHLAALKNNTNIADLLLEKDVDVEAKNSDNSTPLHFAANMGHSKVVKMLVEKKADLNAKDKNGRTPLDKSAYMGKTEIVEYLVKRGANVNRSDNNNKTAVECAASMGHYEIVKLLIENKADLNVIDAEKRTLLHYAVLDGNLDTVKYLIDNKINIFVRNSDGKTAHELAQHKGYEEIAEVLRTAEQDKRSQLQEKDLNELHNAAKTKNLKKIEEPLHLGANIEELDDENQTVLHVAALEGDVELVKYLIQQGANRNIQNRNGRKPLHLACQRGHADVVKAIITKENINATDHWDLTPLHRAAYKGHLKVVETLIESGASKLPNRKKEETVLHSAVRGGHHDIIDYLSKIGMEIWATNSDKETSLHIAARKGRTETVAYLLDKSTDKIDAVDSCGRTALHWAAERGYLQLTKCLVKAGIDYMVENKFQQTALDVAREAKNNRIIEYIEDVKSKSSGPRSRKKNWKPLL